MQGPETDQHELAKLKNAIMEGREETVVIKNYRKDGTTFWNRVQLSPLRDSNNKVMLIVGLQSQVYRDHRDQLTSFTSSSSTRKKSNNHGNGSGSGSTTGSDGVSGICSGSDGNNDSDRDRRRTNDNHHDDGTGKNYHSSLTYHLTDPTTIFYCVPYPNLNHPNHNPVLLLIHITIMSR